MMEHLLASMRSLRRSPSFTLAVVLTLAVGIGMDVAVFSVVNTVLLKPLNAPDSDRIVQFMDTYGEVATATSSPREFNLWREQDGVFQDVSAHWLDHLNVINEAHSELAPVARVTDRFFALYGVPFLRGRGFTPQEDRPGGDSVVILSEELWARDFGSSPDIVGKTILLSDRPYTVIGIVRAGYDSQQFDQTPEAWLPFQIQPNSDAKDSRLCVVTGRLNPGIAMETAKARLRVLADERRRALPGSMAPTDSFTVRPLHEALVGDVRRALIILFWSVNLVLLIVCANVANLLMVRASGRAKEVAIRAAMGASRGRLVVQMLTESLLLSLIGGLLGLLVGAFGIRALLAAYPNAPLGAGRNSMSIPLVGQYGSAVRIDWRVLAYTTVVATLTGAIFGILPGLRISRTDLTSPLKEGGERSGSGVRQSRTRSILVLSEIALAAVLLIGAALLIRTAIALRSVNPGFDARNVLTMQMSLAGSRFQKTTDIDQAVQRGVDGVKGLPGISRVAASCCIPLETVWQLPYVIAGQPLKGRFHGFAGWTFISSGYFEALNIPLLSGRTFTERDNGDAPGVVIINQAMAMLRWPGRNPLGERITLGKAMGPEYDKEPVREIVGIVDDVRDVALNREPRPEVYVPIGQVPDAVMGRVLPQLPIAWIVRTNQQVSGQTSTIQAELLKATGGLPVARVRSLADVRQQSTARTEFNMLVMTVFGFSALILAAIGVYGLTASSVQQTRREIGIRLALGATPSRMRNVVILRAMRLAFIAIVIGVVSALFGARVLASLLFGITTSDPLTFVVVPVFLAVVTFGAVWFPALRATRINPVDTLRGS